MFVCFGIQELLACSKHTFLSLLIFHSSFVREREWRRENIIALRTQGPYFYPSFLRCRVLKREKIYWPILNEWMNEWWFNMKHTFKNNNAVLNHKKFVSVLTIFLLEYFFSPIWLFLTPNFFFAWIVHFISARIYIAFIWTIYVMWIG